MSRILIADDQNDVLEALRILLKGEGHQTDVVTSLAAFLGIWTRCRLARGTRGSPLLSAAHGCFPVSGPMRTMELP